MKIKSWPFKLIATIIAVAALVIAMENIAVIAEEDVYLSDLTPVRVAPEVKDPDSGLYIA